jgi:DNA-binding response OmpR family regulator
MRKRIIVVDDDPGIREIIGIILENAGYEVRLVEDATDILQKNYSLPDLFLIDRLLGGHDGLDICRLLKSGAETKHIPIIMVSASPDIAILSQKAGADGHIEKPFELNHLLMMVARNAATAKKLIA